MHEPTEPKFEPSQVPLEELAFHARQVGVAFPDPLDQGTHLGAPESLPTGPARQGARVHITAECRRVAKVLDGFGEVCTRWHQPAIGASMRERVATWVRPVVRNFTDAHVGDSPETLPMRRIYSTRLPLQGEKKLHCVRAAPRGSTGTYRHSADRATLPCIANPYCPSDHTAMHGGLYGDCQIAPSVYNPLLAGRPADRAVVRGAGESDAEHVRVPVRHVRAGTPPAADGLAAADGHHRERFRADAHGRTARPRAEGRRNLDPGRHASPPR